MSFLGGGENTVARRDHHHHHQSRRKDDEEKKKKKKKRFSSVDDDDEEEAGTTEAKAKVGRMDALLERLETALAEEPRVVLDDDEGTTTTTTSASASLTNCWTSFASAASPLIHSTQSRAASPGSGFSPLLDSEATSQPLSTARLQTSRPT